MKPSKPYLAFDVDDEDGVADVIHHKSGDEEEIAYLASLSTLEYEQQRASVAERLGLRTFVLDKLVAGERKEVAASGGFSLPEPEPWAEPVAGATLLDSLVGAILEYLVLDKHEAVAIALWVLHAHAHDDAQISPRLAIQSATMRSGKTTTLQIVQSLVPRALPAANITAAALFRAVEAAKPTLLIDEADTFLRGSDELRGILNSGHNKLSAYVVRTVGDNHEPAMFRTWAPVVIAMIGALPGTLADRSVVIEMRRKRRDEMVKRFRSDRVDDLAVLSRKAARWAADNHVTLRAWDGDVPASLHDRASDNWRPLLAIADAAGAEWAVKARAAAEFLSGSADDDEAAGVMLLQDIRSIFAAAKADKVATSEILARLHQMETRPWPEWKNGKPMTDRQLAKVLKPFRIIPGTIRLDTGSTPKGYYRSAFDDAFARYT